MSPDTRRILAIMVENEDNDDGEIAIEGRSTFLGVDNIPRRCAEELIRLTAISDVSMGEKVQRFVVNEVGIALNRRPELEIELREALDRGGAYAIKNNRIIEI